MFATATVSLNTNPAVTGRYSVLVTADNGRQFQKATDAPAALVTKMTTELLSRGVFLFLEDETGE